MGRNLTLVPSQRLGTDIKNSQMKIYQVFLHLIEKWDCSIRQKKHGTEYWFRKNDGSLIYQYRFRRGLTIEWDIWDRGIRKWRRVPWDDVPKLIIVKLSQVTSNEV